ncbi:hypothetical protein N781_13010 [Pontibacillus halophilus JSM 076056 = DSM 19796]|uniref:LysM domain-containing protein n=1 Tax=Pontibacillus halophilus JSM 076056 = DSM 19796 TaxID=1385510 RepID=A0A0A5G3B7_9BACI|nr:hypothetical protein [Pontibacillus halophilus]KGX87606.1 hypothetical protein N781_13010 [Pontibacillus halophilus JSM 076056 = DSM 19796]
MVGLLKRLLLVAFVILFLLSIRHDLTVGVFANTTDINKEAPTEVNEDNKQIEKPSNRYQSVKHTVKAGETVLSIVENLNRTGPPVTMEQMILDFESLNPTIDPHQVQVNKTYKFPVYSNHQ